MPKQAPINQPNSGIPNSATTGETTRRMGNLEVQISADAIVKTEITRGARISGYQNYLEELKIQKDLQLQANL